MTDSFSSKRFDERRIIAATLGGSVTDCVFCRIVARQTAADVEYEDEHVMAFRDIYPKAPVHVLIVPKRHIASIAHMSDDDVDVIGRCFLVARRLGEAKGFGEKGYRISVNTGPEGGQVVYHVHFHFTAGRQRGHGA
jgi:histidine triad (HIT) family protein